MKQVFYENRILSDMMMGVPDPHTPKMINAAAPDGAPPRRINLLKKQTVICPAVPKRGPDAGALTKFHYY
jgi:hypothetical protein